MAHLKFHDTDGQTAALELAGDEVVIGRLPECDVVISKGFVSRRHARICRDGDGWRVVDLGSVHGTFVNRLRVTEHVLEANDEIRIGDEVIVFADAIAPADLLKRTVVSGSVLPATAGLGEVTSGAPMKRSPGEVVAEQPFDSGRLMKASMTASGLKELDLVDGGKRMSAQEKSAAGSVPEEQRMYLRLVKITEVMAKCHDAQRVASTAVSLAMRATGADRGILATLEEGDTEFVPRVQLTTVGNGMFVSGEVEISDTFVANAVNKKVAAVARNTWDDVDLSSAKSIVELQIRSILCAPFGDGKTVLGYLYLDSVGAGRMFSPDDLDLVSVIGYQANAQLGRLRLTDKVREEQQRRQNLSRFFSPDVIKHIENESEGGDLDPLASVREQQATVLFADIVGFASISEGMKPPALKRLLDDYFDRMTEILVDRHGGTLDKYIGDAIMALFGAPFTRGVEEDACSAVSAAVEMRDALQTMRSERPEFANVNFRVGVNTGRVVAGMMGSKRRLEYSVIGDAVNVASRLESSGEPGKILIGEETHEAAKNAFICEFAGERQVKNRAKPVKCWWVLRAK